MGGFNSIKLEETVGFADNFSFDGTERGGALDSDGQVWLGSSNSPHVRKSVFTSSDSSLTFAYTDTSSTDGQLNIQANPSKIAMTIQGNVGPKISPSAGNWNIIGSGPVSTTTAGNTITITIASSTFWNAIFGNQNLVSNQGYICQSPGGALSLALPAISSIGDIIEITLDGATSFTITQAAGQSIVLGAFSTTLGIGGSLSSTSQGDSLRMVCTVTNLKWVILSIIGNLTRV